MIQSKHTALKKYAIFIPGYFTINGIKKYICIFSQRSQYILFDNSENIKNITLCRHCTYIFSEYFFMLQISVEIKISAKYIRHKNIRICSIFYIFAVHLFGIASSNFVPVFPVSRFFAPFTPFAPKQCQRLYQSNHSTHPQRHAHRMSHK